MFKKLISIHQFMSTISSKTFSGSFSRYWNENLFFLKNAFFCQNMFKKVVSIHQFMSTISSKTFSGSFSRYWNENLNFFKHMHFFHFLKLRYVPQCVTSYNSEMEKIF